MDIKINQPFALNEIGQRDNNEDSVYPLPGKATAGNRFFLVCDGIGGHQSGEIASRSVCKSFAELLRENNRSFDEGIFNRALNFAYEQLDEKDDDSSNLRKMGTTLTFLYLHHQGAFMAHIGDSRIYQLRKTEDGEATILYKSQDHSLVNDLLRAGVINEEEAENHPKKNVITRAIQPHQEKRSPAEIYRTDDVAPGDYFFLCTDGILEQVNDKKLCHIVASDKTDEEKMKAVYEACQGHSRDNFSAYLIPVQSVSGNAAEVVSAEASPTQVAPAEVSSGQDKGPDSELQMPAPAAPTPPGDAPVITGSPKKRKSKTGLFLMGLVIVLVVLGGILCYTHRARKPEPEVKEDTIRKTGPAEPADKPSN